MECYFHNNGTAELKAGGIKFFNYFYDEWMNFKVVIDLDNDNAEFWMNSYLIHTWKWTLGASGTGSSLKLAANHFFGAFGITNMMYIDNYWFSDSPNSVESEIDQDMLFLLSQNYPNPFNPTTTIKYRIPELSFVAINVYDVLGNEIATLINEEKPAGEYVIDFNTSNLPSGICFYRLRAGQYVETRKMVLLR